MNRLNRCLWTIFGIIGIIGIVALVFVTMLGQVNILGKRIRDMGLPVLWTILGIVAISMILNVIFPPEVTMAAASVQTAEWFSYSHGCKLNKHQYGSTDF